VRQVRAALADDLDAPAALAAVDAWAGASSVVESDDAYAPTLVARACDALLGIRL
jgi:L-cysteine:1D-myo-inositol 2-amino-2-deoxy-alpha-D-glucopyranoside ligase